MLESQACRTSNITNTVLSLLLRQMLIDRFSEHISAQEIDTLISELTHKLHDHLLTNHEFLTTVNEGNIWNPDLKLNLGAIAKALRTSSNDQGGAAGPALLSVAQNLEHIIKTLRLTGVDKDGGTGH